MGSLSRISSAPRYKRQTFVYSLRLSDQSSQIGVWLSLVRSGGLERECYFSWLSAISPNLPQFAGILRVNTMQELIKAVKTATPDRMAPPQRFFYYGKGKTLRRDNTFQDFRMVENNQKGNINAVQHVWTDTKKAESAFKALISGDRRLRVEFTNAAGAYPGNIAIRGQEDRPLENRPFKQFLMFAARLHETSAENVSVAIRVVNGYLQHWVYGGGTSAYFCELIKSTEWHIVQIDLGDSTNWTRFDSDGNPEGPSVPGFECICSVVLEVGGGSVNSSRPGAGTGVLEIGPLVVLDDVSHYEKYLPSN